MRTTRLVLLVIALIAVLPAASASLNAQNNQTGNIHGVVTDQSAALIPGVMVTLTSPALIVSQVAVTDEAGGYHFEQLPVGVYKIFEGRHTESGTHERASGSRCRSS